ncbi:unnamed protein product [Adineta steineri]|uniref:Uncharacterized protein n=1 Tax=Adineta steineri TaxID=433720 RepID=A0A814VTE3_9BILA|nr:unnamed protein product [Adineta steineri]CAF1077828.1 unnamed protein product [Adineta steineri]CAF1096500.1 unnamed protein product [Adineta steineri]CAF1132318.1 unnamed protein product [Adineta steineri]CAF1195430.1 unnamed protein product [Adineta steineri]
MGLFNSGKNEKVEKVSKYERHYNVPQNSTRRRSSKHRSHQGEPAARAMSQPPLMRIGHTNGGGNGGAGAGGYYQAPSVFNQPIVGGMGPNVLPPNLMTPNVLPQVRYPIQPFDLSKFATPNAYATNPFNGGQIGAMNLASAWSNGLALANNRPAFQQPLNEYQQAAWPQMSPANYGYMPPMQF